MGKDYEMIISIKFQDKTKADIKRWAESMTLWELYELSKTDTAVQATLYKLEMTMVEEVEAEAVDME